MNAAGGSYERHQNTTNVPNPPLANGFALHVPVGEESISISAPACPKAQTEQEKRFLASNLAVCAPMCAANPVVLFLATGSPAKSLSTKTVILSTCPSLRSFWFPTRYRAAGFSGRKSNSKGGKKKNGEKIEGQNLHLDNLGTTLHVRNMLVTWVKNACHGTRQEKKGQKSVLGEECQVRRDRTQGK